MKRESILVVDDDKEIVRLVRSYLEKAGYEVFVAYDGETALHTLRREKPDLLILDLMLPDRDGWDIARLIRADTYLAATPIIMLTARVEDSDKIVGLEIGADDYITKPFNPQEVVSRVRAVLRRSDSAVVSTSQQPIQIKDMTIDPVARNVEVNGKSIILTAKEFDLLWHFAQHPQQVFTRAQLLAQVWGDEFYTDPSTVTVHIRRLREKIEANPSQPQHILTVWSVGYKFAGDK